MASLSFTQPLERALILAKEVSPCTFLSISLFRKSLAQQVVFGINKRGLNLFQPSERLKKAGMLLAGNEPGNQRFPDCTLYPLIYHQRPFKTAYKAVFSLYGVFPQHLPATKNAAKRRK